MKILTNQDVADLLDYRECLEVVEDTFFDPAHGNATNRPRTHTYSRWRGGERSLLQVHGRRLATLRCARDPHGVYPQRGTTLPLQKIPNLWELSEGGSSLSCYCFDLPVPPRSNRVKEPAKLNQTPQAILNPFSRGRNPSSSECSWSSKLLPQRCSVPLKLH